MQNFATVSLLYAAFEAFHRRSFPECFPEFALFIHFVLFIHFALFDCHLWLTFFIFLLFCNIHTSFRTLTGLSKDDFALLDLY